MRKIIYYYRGGVERGTGNGYEWRDGYSETTEAGSIVYPWLTMRECQADARKRGAVAEFGKGPGKIDPQKPARTRDGENIFGTQSELCADYARHLDAEIAKGRKRGTS